MKQAGNGQSAPAVVVLGRLGEDDERGDVEDDDDADQQEPARRDHAPGRGSGGVGAWAAAAASAAALLARHAPSTHRSAATLPRSDFVIRLAGRFSPSS